MDTLSNTEKYDHFLIKCHFKLVFNDNQSSTWSRSNLFDNKTIISWEKNLDNVIDDFNNKGYNLNHTGEMNIITKSDELDMAYEFCFKHNLQAVEWKLNAMKKKNKKLISKFIETWRHPLIRKFDGYRV